MTDGSNTPLDAQLANWLASEHRQAGVRVVGINGAQGSGKSTLARHLASRLSQDHGLRAVILGLDDLYLPQAARTQLAARVHPLLATRGVPGTHDVALGAQLLARLPTLKTGESMQLPHFLKLADERAPEAEWPAVTGPVDLVLFEGWCVATPAQDDAALERPINDLEAAEDADGRWRRWVNRRLATDYATLFAPLQRLIFLQAPSFDCVFRWRAEQEHGDNLREATIDTTNTGHRAMNDRALRRFIAHYERLTRHALAMLPDRADAVVSLDKHRVPHTVRLHDRS